MLDSLLSVFAPYPCSRCGDISAILCESCKYDIVYDTLPRCIECGEFVSTGICKSHNASYDTAWCIGERRDILERLINQLKFQRLKKVSNIAADLLNSYIPELPASTVVTTIPTASSHIRARGYDHAHLIAQQFAKTRSLQFMTLIRRSHDLSQKSATRKGREEQAKTAFTVPSQLDPTKPYLLIDDITTTGATLRYASDALISAGARIIWVAVIARQPLD